MNFGGPLAIIVHYTVQFNLECCKSSVSDMDPNTILKMLNILSKDVLKVKLQKFQHTIIMKFGRPLAITVHYTIQFNLECFKSYVPDMGPNAIVKIKNIYIKNILKAKLKIFPTYHPYELWWTTCHHSPLHSTIQFGVLQKLCVGHGP